MKDRLLTTDEIKKYHWIYISPASIETTIAMLQEQDKKSVAVNNAEWREKIESLQGEWLGVAETYCPDWVLDLRYLLSKIEGE